jgi:hypothetical protein
VAFLVHDVKEDEEIEVEPREMSRFQHHYEYISLAS